MAMAVSVKICGVTSPEALDAAIAAGAEQVGFVFYKPSPRNLTLRRACELAEHARGRLGIVALTVNARYGFLKALVSRIRPAYLQLHGGESPERSQAISKLVKTPVIKAVRVKSPADIRAAWVYEPAADVLLFDAYSPASTALPGGNGVSFDWSWLKHAPLRPNFMLSGGLNPGNVRLAVTASGATSVDVSSGVETAPGSKDPALIALFTAAAKSAAATHSAVP